MIPNASQILYAPGKLCYNPGDLGSAYPHGGTALGIVKSIALSPQVKLALVTAEEYGGAVVEAMPGTAESWGLTCVLRDFDADAVGKVFGNFAGGVVTEPGANRAGRLMSSSSVVLCFSPNAPTIAPAVVFHRAIPLVQESAVLAMSRAAEFGVPISFLAIRSIAGKTISMGPIGSIAL